MFNYSVIPETPQILSRLGSLFRRKLSKEPAFANDDSTQSSVVLESPTRTLVPASQAPAPTQDGDTSLDSSGDASSLLLTQPTEHQTDASSSNSDAPIPTIVSCREDTPLAETITGLNRVQLFRGPKAPLSAFYHHPLRWQNHTFISAEQAYQYAKLVHHKVTVTRQREMLRCKSSHACKQLAYKCVPTSNASWDLKKYELMEKICSAKFQQCRKFKEALRGSGDAHLLHNTETDSVWGCGPDLNGQNKMGHILMNIRRRDVDYAQEFPPLPQANVQSQAPASNTVPDTSPRNVVVLGNSNARGMSRKLGQKGITSAEFVYPGQTADYITRRVGSIDLPAQAPDVVLLHVGDVEVRNFNRPISSIAKNIRTLVETVREHSSDVPIIISGLPEVPGHGHLNKRIAYVNNASSHLCHEMNNVRFVSNKTAALARDRIHLTEYARDLFCRNISYLVRQCI